MTKVIEVAIWSPVDKDEAHRERSKDVEPDSLRTSPALGLPLAVGVGP